MSLMEESQEIVEIISNNKNKYINKYIKMRRKDKIRTLPDQDRVH